MSGETRPKLPSHLDYLDGIRGLAALWVVLHHSWFEVTEHLAVPPIRILAGLRFGRPAVDMFIVLSGFCLMLPVLKAGGTLRNGPIDFLRRRAWRILPPYYAALALSLLLVRLFIGHKTGTHWDNSLPVTDKSVVTHLLLVQDVFGEDYTINHVFWSIAVEWRIYFLFPLLLVGWRYLGPVATLFLALIGSWLLNLFCHEYLEANLTLDYLGLFAGGMFGAAVVFSPSPTMVTWRAFPWRWITLVVTTIVVMQRQFEDYEMGLWSVCFLVMTSLDANAWHHKILSYPPLVFIGTFAYSIYLVHAPLIQMIWQYALVPFHGQPATAFTALVMPGVPAVLALSYLFFLCFERPYLHRQKPLLSRSTLA